MTKVIHGPWADYAREQKAVRKRELHELTDVSGDEALDFIIDAIANGNSFNVADARRSRFTASRRERSQQSIRVRDAAAYESDLVYRSGKSPETGALLSLFFDRLPGGVTTIMLLDAQGYTDQEAGSRVGVSAATVRQRISRATRRLAS